MFTLDDHRFMLEAIELAHQAALAGEVPVGALLVHENEVIGRGSNCPISGCDPSAHAEIVALREGALAIKNYRLINSTLYITLEPCLMCVGAIVHARVKRVVFGAYDPKAGAVESAFSFSNSDKLNHKPLYLGGLMATQCADLLKDFFLKRREVRKSNRNKKDT